jgi:hypothetical protein
MQERGPRAQVFSVPDCGHAPALQDAAQLQIIEQFISKKSP